MVLVIKSTQAVESPSVCHIGIQPCVTTIRLSFPGFLFGQFPYVGRVVGVVIAIFHSGTIGAKTVLNPNLLSPYSGRLGQRIADLAYVPGSLQSPPRTIRFE